MPDEKPERTMFDALSWILRGFSLLVWVTMGVMLYVTGFSGHESSPSFLWQEKLAIGTVFLMSLAIWWFAGFVARKGREKVAAGLMVDEDD